jgi:hypothetical protein
MLFLPLRVQLLEVFLDGLKEVMALEILVTSRKTMTTTMVWPMSLHTPLSRVIVTGLMIFAEADTEAMEDMAVVQEEEEEEEEVVVVAQEVMAIIFPPSL